MSKISSITQMMAVIPRITQTVTQVMTIIPVTIRTSSIAKTVIIQPWVSLWVSLGISLGSGLGLSLLYGLDRLLLSSSGGGGRDQTVGKDSVSAGDGGTLIVLAANRGRVDDGVVQGVWMITVCQRKMARGVDKPGLGLGLSSCIGGDS